MLGIGRKGKGEGWEWLVEYKSAEQCIRKGRKKACFRLLFSSANTDCLTTVQLEVSENMPPRR
eukprot:9919901-Prorocentrum_lima.AAC.1